MTDRRVIAEYVETWDGAHKHPGFCVVRVVEQFGKPIRVERGRPCYIAEYPEMNDWSRVHKMAENNMKAMAFAPRRRRKK